MKTLILTIAIALSTVLSFSNSASAATADHEVSTILTDVSNINEIEVHGNVELYLSDATADKVKVYNSYYAESALVQDQNGVLRITSYNAQKLVVWVSVNDLHKLSVYDNSEVKSFGKLSAIDLDVKVYNNAAARLNLDALEASVTLSDRAKADLAGTIIDGSIKYDRSASLNTTDLAANNLVKTVRSPRIEISDIAELASL